VLEPRDSRVPNTFPRVNRIPYLEFLVRRLHLEKSKISSIWDSTSALNPSGPGTQKGGVTVRKYQKQQKKYNSYNIF